MKDAILSLLAVIFTCYSLFLIFNFAALSKAGLVELAFSSILSFFVIRSLYRGSWATTECAAMLNASIVPSTTAATILLLNPSGIPWNLLFMMYALWKWSGCIESMIEEKYRHRLGRCYGGLKELGVPDFLECEIYREHLAKNVVPTSEVSTNHWGRITILQNAPHSHPLKASNPLHYYFR